MRATVDDFIAYLKSERGMSANTLAAYRSDLAQFITFAGRRGVTSWNVPPSLVHEYLTHLIEREYQSSSQARKLAAVKALFRHLHAQGEVPTDPTAGLGGTRVKKRRPRVITPSEVERLLEQPAAERSPEMARDRAMLELLYATGMRVSELVALELGDIAPDLTSVTLARQGARQRTVPLTERAHSAVRSYIVDQRGKILRRQDEPAVFLNHRGNRLTRQGFWLIIKGHAKRAGIAVTITPHTLRHSFATHRLRAQGSVREVQELLGHASIATTQIYAELAREGIGDESTASAAR